jgi:xeroderma pigmentosum group C-complementing protein
MPPKRSGRVASRVNKSSNGEGSAEAIAERGSNDVSNGKKLASRGRRGVTAKNAASSSSIPDVYKELLAETIPAHTTSLDRPLKRRKTGNRGASAAAVVVKDGTDHESNGEEDMEFEDVLDTVGLSGSEQGAGIPSLNIQQTAYRDSDDESDDEGSEWDGVDFGKLPTEEGTSGDLELTFNINTSPTQAKNIPRRRVVTKDEKNTRLEVHRMHVLCLLSHVSRKNTWCNDPEIHKILKSLLDKKVLADLHPKEDLSQFAKTEFLKRGLEKVNRMWKYNFDITARGQRRALWADEDVDLKNVCHLSLVLVLRVHVDINMCLLCTSINFRMTLSLFWGKETSRMRQKH